MGVLDCWYKDACDKGPVCEYPCLTYQEMSYLVDQRYLPRYLTHNLKMYCSEDSVDYDAFMLLNDIRKQMNGFVDNHTNLYISSKNTGNGKTTWAVKLLMSYFNKIQAGNAFKCRGLFLQVPMTLLKFKDFSDQNRDEIADLKKKLLDVDIVVWDDLGSSGLSQYDLSNLFAYIDARLAMGKSNIFTSNLTTREDLTKALGPRLATRIYDTSLRVELKGRNYRGTTSIIK